jgi:hypothetical protein
MSTRDQGGIPSAFTSPRKAEKYVGSADWGSVDAKKLVHLIETASRKGGALRLGYTRDGGAYAIGVYAGPNYFTDYVRPEEDIDEYLELLTDRFEHYDGSQDAVPEKKSNRRAR